MVNRTVRALSSVPAFFIVLALTACGGGGIVRPSNLTPGGSTSASVSEAIPASGGSESVTLGSQTITVTAPAGAFPSGATLKLTLQTGSSVSSFASSRHPASGTRAAQSIPSGATALAGFTLDAGGATVAVPLTITLAGVSAPSSGNSVMISGFANGAYDDVSTASVTNGTASETTSINYPGLTLASATQYVLYSAPTSNIAAPSASIAITGPATIAPAATGTYSAAESTVNGFPFFNRTFTYGVSSPGVGTITTTANTGVLTAGGIGGGNITATDTAVSTFTGALAITISSARPGTSGLSQNYTGTLTETIYNDAINSSPVTTSTTYAVSLGVTAAADATDTSGTTAGVTFTANESDVANLETLTSTTASTVLYQQQPSGITNVRLKKTVANESSGVIYETDYTATNGLTTILPETAGTFSNDASETYLETDPGLGVISAQQNVTIDKVVNADGSYTSNFLDPNVYTATPVADVATVNSDFSSTLALNSVDPSNFLFSFSAPSGGSINVSETDPNFGINNTLAVPSYIPPMSTQPSMESDTITTGVALDANCPNHANYATATAVKQTLAIVDTAFGTVENRSTTSYDIAGTGTVCVVVSDTINAFYDFTGQEGSILTVTNSATAPLLITTETEGLALSTTTGGGVQAGSRSAASAISGRVTMIAPAATLAFHVQNRARERMRKQLTLIKRGPMSLPIRGGSLK